MSIDELDRSEVRARLAHVRRVAAQDMLHKLGLTPLAEGETPPPVPNDAFGRGPGSPFYDPAFRPPWAPDWDPLRAAPLEYGRYYLGPRDDDDDGIEWRFV